MSVINDKYKSGANQIKSVCDGLGVDNVVLQIFRSLADNHDCLGSSVKGIVFIPAEDPDLVKVLDVLDLNRDLVGRDDLHWVGSVLYFNHNYPVEFGLSDVDVLVLHIHSRPPGARFIVRAQGLQGVSILWQDLQKAINREMND